MRGSAASSCRPAGDGGERAVGDGHVEQLEARLLRKGESFELQAEATPCAAPRRRPAAMRAMAESEPKPPGEASSLRRSLSAIFGFRRPQPAGPQKPWSNATMTR